MNSKFAPLPALVASSKDNLVLADAHNANKTLLDLVFESKTDTVHPLADPLPESAAVCGAEASLFHTKGNANSSVTDDVLADIWTSSPRAAAPTIIDHLESDGTFDQGRGTQEPLDGSLVNESMHCDQDNTLSNSLDVFLDKPCLIETNVPEHGNSMIDSVFGKL